MRKDVPVLSRRELLIGGASALLVASAIGPATSRAHASAPSQRKLQSLGYDNVRLTRGPLKEQYDHTLNFFLNLEDDRILKVYRQKAGLSAPGPDMGGWYNADGFGPGHGLGQWMSALSRFAAAGSTEAKAKVERLVEGYAATLGRGKPFYEYRFPAYIYDKHVIGLADAYRYAGVDLARETLKRTTDLALPFLPEKALTHEEMIARPHKDPTYTLDESYTIAENQFIAYEVFGDERYLEMGKRFLHDEPYFDKLARGEAAMVGKHAYSHVNALGSAAMAYVVLGTEKHLAAIRNAWDMITKDQQFASGGWGPKEVFVEPGKGQLFDSLTKTQNHFETPCGSYATFKLARYLTSFSGESRYGDGLERVLYNGMLAAKRIQPDGSTFYYSNYGAGARKTYHPNKWVCCSGTYPQAIADYLVSAYFHDADSIYVNLYVPSEARWKHPGGDVKLTQLTDYPVSGNINIRVDPPTSTEFSVKLRIPAWADGANLSVNGQAMPQSGAVKAGSYAEIRRRWAAGDTIDLTLPMVFRTEAIDAQHPSIVALLRGPVMHVAVGEASKLSMNRNEPAMGKDVRFVPFYRVADEAYTTYLKRA
jgi:DUF1680 family protein